MKKLVLIKLLLFSEKSFKMSECKFLLGVKVMFRIFSKLATISLEKYLSLERVPQVKICNLFNKFWNQNNSKVFDKLLFSTVYSTFIIPILSIVL